MYRIKTDIRQYKCETQDKVEKLIRNWVIRPNDLIYLPDAQEWSTIGEHPEFIRLFDVMAAQDRAEPDTVVTSSPQRTSIHSTELGNTTSEEVTSIRERPSADEPSKNDVDEDDEETNERIEVPDDMRATDIIDEDEVADHIAREDAEKLARQQAKATAQPKAEAVTDSPDPDPDDADPDVTNDDDVAAEDAEDAPAPPEAPEGVEPVVVADEVTMMTEKTLDLLIIDDRPTKDDGSTKDKDDDPSKENDDPSKENDDPSKEKDDPSKEKDDVDATLAGPLGPTEDNADLKAKPSNDTLAKKSEPDSSGGDTNTSDGSEAEADETLTENPDPLASTTDRGSLSVGKRVGRHNLPEEFFATNEITTPVDREQLRLDDLGELSEPEDEGEGEGGEDPKEDWNQEDLRTTAELNPEEIQKVIQDDLDEASDEDDEEEVEVEHDEYEEDDDYDEDEWDDELDASEVAAVLLAGKGDHVEDPYAIPLPFEIAPNDDDIRVGLRRDTRTRATKDRSFPYPTAKVKDVVIIRRFDLTPEPAEDRTVLFMAGFAALFIVSLILLFILT